MTIFGDIDINRDGIPQEILNIDTKTRTNLFAWNGQFSPQFVEAMLSVYAGGNSSVIDTFAGCGTVLGECAGSGLECYGTAINAPAYFMAKTYEVSNMSEAERLGLLCSADDFILCACMNGGDILGSVLAEIRNNSGTPYSDVLSALVVITDIYNHPVTPEILRGKWQKLGKIIAALPYSTSPVRAARRDARDTGLENDTADMLLTSPPYINVLNYHQEYRRSAEALGCDVLKAARSEIGSNRKNRGNRFLTVIQYCLDMAGAMREAARVCREGARMIYVVGRESRIMGVPFCNSELIYDIGAEILGFNFEMRQERYFMNRFGQVIYEDILHFRNRKHGLMSDEDIAEYSRDIAVKMLAGKLKNADSRTRPLIEDALARKDSVKPSELFRP